MNSITNTDRAAAQRGDERLDYVDALRAFAMLGVIAVHCSGISKPTGSVAIFSENGARGVQLFFILSAFTMFFTMTRAKAGFERTLLSFFSRRFFRIAPLYYLVLLYFKSPAMSYVDLIPHFLFINAWMPNQINSAMSVEWSIAIEMNFYLAVPFLFNIITSSNRAILTVLIGTITCLLSIWYLEPFLLSRAVSESDKYNAIVFARNFSLMDQFALFGAGFFYYFEFLKIQLWKHTKSRNQLKYYSLFWLFIAAVALRCLISQKIQSISFPYHIAWLAPFLSVLYALQLWAWKPLVNRFTCFLGKISFSCYLLHIFVVYRYSSLVETAEKSGNVYYFKYFCIVLALTFVGGTCAYYLIEKPAIKIGRKLTSLIAGSPLLRAA